MPPYPGPYFTLIEFKWLENQENYNRTEYGWTADPTPSIITSERRLEHVFYFIPRPSSIRKNVQMNWKIDHTGTQRLKKVRYRNRETVEYRISGSFSETMRFEFEYYQKQESKFHMTNHYMPNPDSGQYDHDPNEDEADFVVIKSANFAGVEGRLFVEEYDMAGRGLRVDYEIVLERCTSRDVEGWETEY